MVHAPGMRTIGAAAVEVLQHFVGIDEKYFEALTTSFVSQGLSQVRFSNAGRAAYKRIVMLTYEIATGHLQYLLSAIPILVSESSPNEVRWACESCFRLQR